MANDFSNLKTPVLFMVFNRIDTTMQVFDMIKKAKPPRLYLSSDGARIEKKGEDEIVNSVRDFVLRNIDWDCKVFTLFRDENLGCKDAVSNAISWFFQNETQGIILEDDCVPSLSFFWYCEELLNKYKESEDIFLISGDGRATSKIAIDDDYTFIKYPIIWGWASWRRVWDKYDVTISEWPSLKNQLLKRISKRKSTKKFWGTLFQAMYEQKIDTWDFQLSFLLLKDNGKCIIPRVNLIKNIGFGPDATHTFNIDTDSANIQQKDINFPLSHPSNQDCNHHINDYYDVSKYYQISFFKRILNRIARITIGRNIFK